MAKSRSQYVPITVRVAADDYRAIAIVAKLESVFTGEQLSAANIVRRLIRRYVNRGATKATLARMKDPEKVLA